MNALCVCFIKTGCAADRISFELRLLVVQLAIEAVEGRMHDLTALRIMLSSLLVARVEAAGGVSGLSVGHEASSISAALAVAFKR